MIDIWASPRSEIALASRGGKKIKKVLKMSVVLGIALALFCSASFYIGRGAAQEEPPAEMPQAAPVQTDWMEVMIQAATEGDENTGIAAQNALSGDVRYEDLFLLAKVIAWESGPNWEDWGLIAIGEVVLNRVASPEFPNTIRDVLYQTDPIQYEPVWLTGWEEYIPPERYVRVAHRLLEGERVMNDSSVVFQALFPQGSEIALTYHDDDLSNDTFFCRSYDLSFYSVG